MKKVNLQILKPWITKRVIELMGFEDEVVIEMTFNMLEDSIDGVDPRVMQINLTGFLEDNAPIFVLELWKLIQSAETSPMGIPPEFLEMEKEAIRKKKVCHSFPFFFPFNNYK
jgi:hypothetical protein